MVFKVRLTVLLFVGCLVFNPLCGAIVRGRVTDTAGKTLQDAKVLFQNLNTSGKVKLKSNKRGEFQASVPAGAYRVLVEKEGYKATYTRVTLGTLGGAPTLRFKLESGKRGVFAFELSKDALESLQRKQKKQVAQRQASATATRFFFEGKKLMGMGEFLEAAKSFEKAAKAKPDGVQIWEQLGNARSENKQYDQAIKAFQKAIEFYPEEKQMGQAALSKRIGDIYTAQGNEGKAKEFYVDANYVAGLALLQEARNNDAAEKFKSVIKLAPRHADAHYQLGLALVGTASIKEGLKYLEAYVKIAPNEPNAAIAESLIKQLEN